VKYINLKIMETAIENYIGIFSNAFTKEYCEKVIKWFEQNNKRENTISRQELEGVPKSDKDSQMYFFSGDKSGKGGSLDSMTMECNSAILAEYNEICWQCYDKLKQKYGFMDNLGFHKMSSSVKIQKYKPSQGYHAWHCDNGNMLSSRRMMVCLLYLNTVKSGGETEFIYQSKRIAPEQGTLLMFPPYWTHIHRGNPPLKGNKYIMNTWLEFMD